MKPPLSTEKIEYVLGFAFNQARSEVLLIKKNRPEWQAGLLNGVGGKVEHDDRLKNPTNWAGAAMQREFFEETNIETDLQQWTRFANHIKLGQTKELEFDSTAYTLHVFSTILSPSQFKELKRPTDEKPYVVDISSINMFSSNLVPGTFMYIAMALNHMYRPFSTYTIERSI